MEHINCQIFFKKKHKSIFPHYLIKSQMDNQLVELIQKEFTFEEVKATANKYIKQMSKYSITIHSWLQKW